jgi:membrane protein DedA with SNARE-associated domain
VDTAYVEGLIRHYGYLAVWIGTMLEGETVLLMAGLAARLGYLDIRWVVPIAALGGFLGDQIFFALGRARGRQMLERFPSVHAQAARVEQLLSRYRDWLIVGIRFMYGLRVAGPVLFGMSQVSRLRFAVLNLIGALLWALLIGGAGYLFGQAVSLFLKDAQHYELVALTVIVVVGISLWLYRRHSIRKSVKGEG